MSLGLTFVLYGSLCYLSSMSPGLTFVMYGSLCCPSFYVTWSRFHYIWVLCCLILYVTWSHYRSVCFFMLAEFLCHLFSLSLCMGLYVVRVSMALGLTFVMHGSLCCPSFYVTWSLFCSACVLVLPEFLCHLVSHPLCICL